MSDALTASAADSRDAARLSATPSFARTLRGVWGLTWRGWFAWRRALPVAAILLANPALAWLSIPPGGESVFLDWAIRLFLDLLVPLYCLIVCGAMIRDEVQEDTLGFLITRPVTRARLYTAEYICHLLWLEVVMAANASLLIAVGWAKGMTVAIPFAGPFLLAGALVVPAYAALGALFGLVTRRYVVFGLVYGFLVEIGVGHIPTNVNSLSMMRHGHTLLANSPAVQEHFGWSPDKPGIAALILAGASLLALLAGSALFTLREYHVSKEIPQ